MTQEEADMDTHAAELPTRYVVSGHDGADTVMLAHSLASSHIMWAPQVRALEPRYRVLRYDIRGHGASGVPAGPYTLEQLAADAVSLLDALDIDRVHFVGLSMGGMIGQALALHHRDRLLSLGLCDTTARIPASMQPVWRERIERARAEGMAALVEETIARWFTEPARTAGAPAIDMIREQILATPVEGFVGCCEAISALDYLDRLDQVDLPTLILVGEQDPSTPVVASEAIQARIPGSRLVRLADAAHLSNIEQAAGFNEALLAFLDATRR